MGYKVRFYNLGMRSLALVSKFALMLYLVNYMDLASLGVYGLVSAVIAFSVILLGFEFHTYSNRIIIKGELSTAFVVLNALLFYAACYVLLLPLHLLLFKFSILPSGILELFFAVLVSEHISQEVSRYLIAKQRQLQASAVLFLRLGSWVWILVSINELFTIELSVELVLSFWLFGSMLSIFLGVVLICLADKVKLSISNYDATWILKGVRTSAYFLLITLSIKLVMTLDKILVKKINGEDFLGVYSVYFSLSLAMTSVLIPLVFSFLYPRLVAFYSTQKMKEFLQVKREMYTWVVIIALFYCLGMYFFCFFIFHYLGQSDFVQNINVLIFLLIASGFFCLSMVPHYSLYAKSQDSKLLISNVVSIFVFFACVLIPSSLGVYLIPFALSSSMVSLFILKVSYDRGVVAD